MALPCQVGAGGSRLGLGQFLALAPPWAQTHRGLSERWPQTQEYLKVFLLCPSKIRIQWLLLELSPLNTEMEQSRAGWETPGFGNGNPAKAAPGWLFSSTFWVLKQNKTKKIHHPKVVKPSVLPLGGGGGKTIRAQRENSKKKPQSCTTASQFKNKEKKFKSNSDSFSVSSKSPKGQGIVAPVVLHTRFYTLGWKRQRRGKCPKFGSLVPLSDTTESLGLPAGRKPNKSTQNNPKKSKVCGALPLPEARLPRDTRDSLGSSICK